MKFVMVMLIVRFIIALFAEKHINSENEDNVNANNANAGNANANDVNANNAGIHPAEFELRDHYFMRCSE